MFRLGMLDTKLAYQVLDRLLPAWSATRPLRVRTDRHLGWMPIRSLTALRIRACSQDIVQLSAYMAKEKLNLI
jgi:hypothetical protein